AFIPVFLIGYYLHLTYSGKKSKVQKEVKPQITSPKKSEPKTIPKKDVKSKAIHKKEDKPKIAPKREVKPKEKFSSKKLVYSNYELQNDKLKSEFDIKEENIRVLIERRFPAPQMTNDKFNSIVNKCHEIFHHRADIISTLIASSTEYSERVEEEIQSNILVLKEINGKLDALSDEILVNISETKSDDIKDLLEEIDRLTDSVSDYN
ncbi:MAG: hypothetical protein Q4Q14_08840, partial [Methanobrevibacter sp.]|nr:hypothetical protein [Methanobrevibacter sp.]